MCTWASEDKSTIVAPPVRSTFSVVYPARDKVEFDPTLPTPFPLPWYTWRRNRSPQMDESGLTRYSLGHAGRHGDEDLDEGPC